MATGPAGDQLDMAVQGPGSSWALGPICQVGNQNTVGVPQGLQLGAQASLLVVPERVAQGVQQEQVALGMVLVWSAA